MGISYTHLDESQSISESLSKEDSPRAVVFKAGYFVNDHEEITKLAIS